MQEQQKELAGDCGASVHLPSPARFAVDYPRARLRGECRAGILRSPVNNDNVEVHLLLPAQVVEQQWQRLCLVQYRNDDAETAFG